MYIYINIYTYIYTVKSRCFETLKVVETRLPPLLVFRITGCFETPGVSKHLVFRNTRCLNTPDGSKRQEFRNTKIGGRRVSTYFGVSKH